MTEMKLLRQIDQRLSRLLTAHHVELLEPRERMLQLSAVPAGKDFNKQCTNALLRERSPAAGWQVFVNEDLAYAGRDPRRKALFAGVRRRAGWNWPRRAGAGRRYPLRALDAGAVGKPSWPGGRKHCWPSGRAGG